MIEEILGTSPEPLLHRPAGVIEIEGRPQEGGEISREPKGGGQVAETDSMPAGAHDGQGLCALPSAAGVDVVSPFSAR